MSPFWRYYGGKFRAASRYPSPEHDTIVEPFAGAAGYACRHPDRNVILIDKSPIIAGLWRYLIAASSSEILEIPDIPDGGTVDDLPVCQEARWLAGFWCNSGTAAPRKTPSAWARKYSNSHNWVGWGSRVRERVAGQVDRIGHWQIIEGDYTEAPDIEATWHIDPPYNNAAGSLYPHQPGCFGDLASWCRSRRGLVMVCENAGASWLPFRRLGEIKSNATRTSAEVLWLNKSPRYWCGVQSLLPTMGGSCG